MALILVVDDNPVITEFVVDILSPEHEVRTAVNGEEALSSVAEDRPDLIIIDVMMPVMDGIEAVRRLKADPDTRHIPVIMLTALGKDEDIVRGLDAGADDYVEKPFSTKIFNARVKSHLRSKAYYDELKKVDELKSGFIAMASHELRTPLNIIGGYVEILLDGSGGKLNKKTTDILDQVLKSTMSLGATVKDMLDISAIDSGRIPFTPETRDVVPLIHNATDLLGLQSKKKKVGVKTTLTSKKIEALVDAVKFEQIMTNLLSNAIKFTPEGGTVEIKASGTKDALTIEVSDTGSGIAPADIEKVFEEFYHRDSGTQEGTGLGLSICKKLVSLHHGTIHAESNLGNTGGTTLSFTIPVKTKAKQG